MANLLSDDLLKQAIGAHRAGKVVEAEATYRQVIQLDSHAAVAIQNLGLILYQARKLDEALVLLRQSIALSPRNALFNRNLATVLRAKGQLAEAVTATRRAVELAPDDGLCWADFGVSLDLAGFLPEAYAVYEKAIRHLTPVVSGTKISSDAQPPDGTPLMELARAHYNRGSVLGRLGRIQDAMGDYETAIRLVPQFAEPHRNRSGVLFQRGDLKAAWAEYEWRWKCSDYPGKPPSFRQAAWNGEQLEGRTILLWWEQGFGDTIQFCRYAKLVKSQRGGRVALMVQPELKRLLQSLDGVDELAYNGERKIDFSVHASLMSLPHLMGTARDTIPAAKSYLQADPADVAFWKERLAADGEGYRVGLVWAGGASHKGDGQRSIPLAMLAPILAVPNIKFYSLQLGDPAKQIKDCPPAAKMIDHTAHIKDFADSAAFIDQLDLVITVDTAPAHLAGAIGKPVWMLITWEPDFRWMADTDNPSRWYPSMRLFRQKVVGEWGPVIATAAAELALKMR